MYTHTPPPQYQWQKNYHQPKHLGCSSTAGTSNNVIIPSRDPRSPPYRENEVREKSSHFAHALGIKTSCAHATETPQAFSIYAYRTLPTFRVLRAIARATSKKRGRTRRSRAHERVQWPRDVPRTCRQQRRRCVHIYIGILGVETECKKLLRGLRMYVYWEFVRLKYNIAIITFMRIDSCREPFTMIKVCENEFMEIYGGLSVFILR